MVGRRWRIFKAVGLFSVPCPLLKDPLCSVCQSLLSPFPSGFSMPSPRYYLCYYHLSPLISHLCIRYHRWFYPSRCYSLSHTKYYLSTFASAPQILPVAPTVPLLFYFCSPLPVLVATFDFLLSTFYFLRLLPLAPISTQVLVPATLSDACRCEIYKVRCSCLSSYFSSSSPVLRPFFRPLQSYCCARDSQYHTLGSVDSFWCLSVVIPRS